MPSAIDATHPVTGAPVSKVSERANWAAARTELEHGGFFTQVGPGAIERPVQDRLRETIHATDFGTLGTANDGPTIQKAIDEASARGGAFVELPADTILTAQSLLLKTGVILRGQGRKGTTIKLANSANVDVVRTHNFAALTGQNKWFVEPHADGLPYGFGLLDLTVDGNRANNSSGNGVSFYGKNYIVDELAVMACAGDGFYSEAGNTVGQQAAWGDVPETSIGRLWVLDCTGVGFRYRGPHDGAIDSLVALRCTGDNISLETGATYSGTCDIKFIHSYGVQGADSRSLYIAEKCRIGIAICETGGRESIVINNHKIQIGTLFAYLAKWKYTGAEKVYTVWLQGNENTISNLRVHVNGNADGGLRITGTDNRVSGWIDGQNRGAVGLLLAGSRNRIDMTIRHCNVAGGVGAVLGRNHNTTTGAYNNSPIDRCDINLQLGDNAAELDVNGTAGGTSNGTRNRLRVIADNAPGAGLFAAGSATSAAATEQWDIISGP